MTNGIHIFLLLCTSENSNNRMQQKPVCETHTLFYLLKSTHIHTCTYTTTTLKHCSLHKSPAPENTSE